MGPGPTSALIHVGTRERAAALRVPAHVVAIRTGGHSRHDDGGGAVWSRVKARPDHQGWFTTADGSFWRLADRVLRPEMFGAIGADEESDTAAWTALASVADHLAAEGTATVEAGGEYVLSGPVSFRNGRRYDFVLRNAKFRQGERYKPILHFHTCGEVSITDGSFFGLGGEGGEYDGESSSQNGVAAAYFEHVDTVRVRGARTEQFAGGAFFVLGGRVRDFEGVTCQGIGARYIDPRLPTPNQANGGDAALHFVPASPFPGWIYEDRVVNCRLFDHAFGVRNVATRTFVLQGNEIGPCPGQHGVYGTDLDGVTASDNIIHGCRQAGFKNQLENYAGRFAGEMWSPRREYAAGDLVRTGEVLFECKTAHRSGEGFDEGKWTVASRFQRDAGVFSRNRIERCGTGFHQLATPYLKGKPAWSKGWSIEDNVLVDCTESAIRCERMLSAAVSNNRIERSGFASIYLTSFGGRVRGNQIRSSQVSALLISASEDVEITGNQVSDPGLGAADEAQKAVATFFPPDEDTAIPNAPPNPVVTLSGNEFRWSRNPVPRYSVFGYDRRLGLRISDGQTDGALSVRWDGEIISAPRKQVFDSSPP